VVWLPVVIIRPTMFLETFFSRAGPTVRDQGRIELPFGQPGGATAVLVRLRVSNARDLENLLLGCNTIREKRVI
jgi:hypothetical protein